MTDKELTPAQAEAVRRLLAEARHDEPMPDVVARHLDEVVAELAADRANAAAAEPVPTNVVPFRQRRWPKVLVAAAAVSALGLGITQVLDGVSTSGSDDAGGGVADTSLDRGQAARDGDDGTDSEDEARGDAPEVPGPASAPGEEDGLLLDRRVERYLEANGVVVSQDLSTLSSTIGQLQPLPRAQMRTALRHLADNMFAARNKSEAGYDLLANRLAMTRTAYDAAIAPRKCGPIYTVVGGKATYAQYRNKLALVLFHPKVNGAQLVELFVCSGKTPRRSVERVTLWDGE